MVRAGATGVEEDAAAREVVECRRGGGGGGTGLQRGNGGLKDRHLLGEPALACGEPVAEVGDILFEGRSLIVEGLFLNGFHGANRGS